MKIFIFSSAIRTVDVEGIKDVFKDVPSGTELRTSGSKGVDAIIPTLDFSNDNINIEIIIPWDGFNSYNIDDAELIVKAPQVTKYALDILMPNILGTLKPKFVKIDNRLVYGMLGDDLNDPVDIVIINNIDSELLPTTSSALVERLAFNNGIRCINLEYSSLDDLRHLIY